MPKEQIVTGLDIGSAKVAVCVGTLKEGVIDIIGFSAKPNSGVRKGTITDIEETVSAITAALEEAERMSGYPINSVVASISGININCTNSKGVIAINRNDGEITTADVERALEAAKTVAIPANQEILHTLPQYFTIDNQEEVIKDPIGMSGMRLEANTQIVSASLSAVRNVTKCINQAGLDIDDLVFKPIATSQLLLTKKQKEVGVMLLDIGATTTEMVIYEEGNLICSKVFPVGASYITNDIAIGLRTNIEAAEKIKVKHATADINKVKDKDTIKLSSFDSSSESLISKKYIAEIVEARLIEIFSMVKEELRNLKKDGMLPAGVILTGGGAKLDGITDFTKEYLRLPAQIGYPNTEVSGMVDKTDDPMYTASVGLMLYGFQNNLSSSGKSDTSLPQMDKLVDKAKNIFKHFMP